MLPPLSIGALVKKNDSYEVGVIVSIHQSQECGVFYGVMFSKGVEVLDEVLLTAQSKAEE